MYYINYGWNFKNMDDKWYLKCLIVFAQIFRKLENEKKNFDLKICYQIELNVTLVLLEIWKKCLNVDYNKKC